MTESVAAFSSYSLVDELGIDATCQLFTFIDPASTVTQLLTEYAATSLLLDAITGAKIKDGRFVLNFAPDGGVKGSPAAGSRVEQTGVFDFSNVSNSRIWGNAIPALANSKIVSGRINDADSDVIAWVANLLASFSVGHYTNPQDIHLSGVVDTFISFRKRRKQLHRESLSTS